MRVNPKQQIRVLVCPLNWGLGHASRCIPVIRKLQHAGFEVLVAADGRALALLQTECAELTFIKLPGFSPRLSSGSKLIGEMIGWIPSLLWHTAREHRIISSLVETYKISVVISDNRFGLFTPKAISIFITHQIMIKAPRWFSFTEPILYRINRFFIQRFNYCWIPDLPGIDNLAGDLSHKYPLPKNAHFIGLLSRFSRNDAPRAAANGPLLAILSGPEPQRSMFEKLILEQTGIIGKEATIISGTPEKDLLLNSTGNPMIRTHLNTCVLEKDINQAGLVVCRSGYSSLMDMAILKKKEVLVVPTPGQTEQEYLASRVHAKGWYIAQDQQNLNLHDAMAQAERCIGITLQTDESLLDAQITALKKHLAAFPARR